MVDLRYAPLALALLALGLVALAPYSRAVDRLLTRAGVAAFSDQIRSPGTRSASRATVRRERTETLKAAHVPETYPTYAARSFVVAGVVGVAGSVVGAYLGIFAVALVARTGMAAQFPPLAREVVHSLSGPTPGLVPLFLLFVVSSATVGVAAAFGAYQTLWWWPRYVANERGRRIDESLERSTAFIFALSRSGMPFTDILRILAGNKEVFGEAAAEFEVTVKDVDLFGNDLLEALQATARRSPSDQFSEFTQNLVSVLRSGQSLSGFLEEQHERQREESETQQSQFLDLLATLAEGYVTVLVAGPLFLITILVIVGLVGNDTLTFLRVLVYALLPLATVGILVYLDTLSGPTPSPNRVEDEEARPSSISDIRSLSAANAASADETARADGGTDRANRARLAVYDLLRPVRRVARDPVGALVERPVRILALSVPLSLLYVGYRFWHHRAALARTPFTVADDPLTQAALFVLVTFAVVYELHVRRVRAIESEVPDFLERFASTNEAGMPVVESFRRVTNSELGALNTELRRTWIDVQVGTELRQALRRMERRVRTPKMTRAVTLATNAMGASGDIGPVLRIAAIETQAARRLERERRQELLTYVMVIHISFLVFLTIIVALSVIFLPELTSIAKATQEAAGAGSGFIGVGGLGDITVERIDDYQVLLYQSTLVQAVLSGFVAGQMGEGDIKAGAKHAGFMLLLAYAVVLALS